MQISRSLTWFLSVVDARLKQRKLIGVYATLHLSPAGPSEFYFEEDFACLDGSDEDNCDPVTNPLKGRVC